MMRQSNGWLRGSLMAALLVVPPSLFSSGCGKKQPASEQRKQQPGGVKLAAQAREMPQGKRQPDAEPVSLKVKQTADGPCNANNLKQIGLAIHIWASSYAEQFPPSAICDTNGKPLLSWRVLLLPYLDQEDLYKQFRLDEPWDSPNNKKLIDKMPSVFKLSGVETKELGLTHFRTFSGPATLYPNKPGKFALGTGLLSSFKIGNVPDGLFYTILVVEAAEPTIWTKPDDYLFDANMPLPKLGALKPGAPLVLMGNGSVVPIDTEKVSEKTLRLLIQPADGEVIPADFDQ